MLSQLANPYQASNAATNQTGIRGLLGRLLRPQQQQNQVGSLAAAQENQSRTGCRERLNSDGFMDLELENSNTEDDH